MSDHEDIIDLDKSMGSYVTDNKSKHVKFITLGSLDVDNMSDSSNSDNGSSKNMKITRTVGVAEEKNNNTNQKKQIIEIIDNNGWNEKNEKLLAYWKEESHIIIWLNTQALNYNKFINKALSIPAILISAISSATLFSNADASRDARRTEIILLILGVLLIISTFIQALKEFLNIDKNIRQHINIIKTNQMIILDIQEQLNQEIYDRVNGKEFVNKIKVRKADLVRSAVEIPPKFYKKMEKAIENGDIINYDETFILYSYLQNKMTNHSILDPFNNMNQSQNNIPIRRDDTRIDIPQYNNKKKNRKDSDFDMEEPYADLNKVREQVKKINKEGYGDSDSVTSADSVYSMDSINSRTDLAIERKKKKNDDYIFQIKSQIARL